MCDEDLWPAIQYFISADFEAGFVGKQKRLEWRHVTQSQPLNLAVCILKFLVLLKMTLMSFFSSVEGLLKAKKFTIYWKM